MIEQTEFVKDINYEGRAPDVNTDLIEGPLDDRTTWSLLREINENIQRMADNAEQQRVRIAPGLFDLSSTAGLPPQPGGTTGVLYSVTMRLRIATLRLITANGTDLMRITIGSRQFNFYQYAGDITFPYIVDRGIDIQVQNVTTPANAFSAFLFAYPE